MRRESDLRLAGWLAGLERSARVAGILPGDFQSYLRIFHKAHHPFGTGPDSVPAPTGWGAVASALGRDLVSGTVWPDLSGAYGEPALVPGTGSVYPPEEGRLDAAGFKALAGVLAESVRGPFRAAFWTGWEPLLEDPGAAEAIHRRETVTIQGQQYLLYSLERDDLADAGWMLAPEFGWAAGNGLTPNYLWPADYTWCLGTHIDMDSSILAGSSSLMAEVGALPALESLPVDLATDLTSSVPPDRGGN